MVGLSGSNRQIGWYVFYFLFFYLYGFLLLYMYLSISTLCIIMYICRIHFFFFNFFLQTFHDLFPFFMNSFLLLYIILYCMYIYLIRLVFFYFTLFCDLMLYFSKEWGIKHSKEKKCCFIVVVLFNFISFLFCDQKRMSYTMKARAFYSGHKYTHKLFMRCFFSSLHLLFFICLFRFHLNWLFFSFYFQHNV